MRAMDLSRDNIERRKAHVGLGPQDLQRIAAARPIVQPRVDELVDAFFAHLAPLDEARGLIGNRPALEEARRLKRTHLLAMFDGDYGAAYVEQRMTLALLYTRTGLAPRVFVGAYGAMLRAIARLMPDLDHYLSLEKVGLFDIGVITDVLIYERERIIRQQSEAIRELSVPVLQIRDRLLLMPLIGVIDTHRARLITESLLAAIRANRARVVVMDVTGVATIDSKVANHLLQTVTAAKLMGALVIVTGLSAEVAQSLVALGIDVNNFTTVGDLQGGVEDAERLLGYRVARVEG